MSGSCLPTERFSYTGTWVGLAICCVILLLSGAGLTVLMNKTRKELDAKEKLAETNAQKIDTQYRHRWEDSYENQLRLIALKKNTTNVIK